MVIVVGIMGVLPASFVYSFIIAYCFLRYFSKEKNDTKSWIIFIVATIHLTFVFVLPIIILMVLDQGENIGFKFEDDVTNSALAFEIMSITNHILNKIVYPASIIYYESGFISKCYKFIPLTLKGWVNWVKRLWIVPVAIILGIVYLFYKEKILYYYKNVLVYYLNYLNILDLVKLYFELGFCVTDSIRYFCRACCQKNVYKKYIKGKLIYHKQQLYYKFQSELETLSSITHSYSGEIEKHKLTKIFAFVNKQKQYLIDKDICDSKSVYSSQSQMDDITKIQLEKLISSPIMEVKQLRRKIVRINNLYDLYDLYDTKTEKLEFSKCCQCMKCLLEIIKLLLFFFICLIIIYLEIKYYKQYEYVFFGHNNSTNANNISYYSPEIDDSTINNNTNNTLSYEKYHLGIEILAFFYLYIFLLPFLAISTGFYLIPILYAVVKRNYITGEYIYEKECSNNLEIILSVEKITSLVSASMYLGALLYIHIILKDKPTSDNFKEFFKFFDLPYTEVVLAIKMVFFALVMIITNREYIRICSFEKNIADEGAFYLCKTDCWCYKLFKGRKEKYFQLAEVPDNSSQKSELFIKN